MRDGRASDGFALARWVGLVMILPALMAVTLLGKDTLMVVERIDDAALDHDAAAIDRGLRMLGELNGSEVLARASKSSAFRHIVQTRRPEWMREQFGSGALAADGLQHLYIVDPTGQVIFSSADDGTPQHTGVSGIIAAAAKPMERARALYRSVRGQASGVGKRTGGLGDALYVNDIVLIDGLPAMVTAAPFVPGDEGYQMPNDPTLLLGVQPMTTRLLNKLEALSHVTGIRLVPDARAARGIAHPIRDSGGNVVSYATWNFSPPGSVILKAAFPAIALSLALIAFLTLFAAFTTRRLTRKLAESEQAAVQSARQDAATGLANRGWFMRVFEDVLASGGGKSATYAVLLVDCDHFKSINDTLGHAAGDAVLSAIAHRLRAFGLQITIAARLGGDEFAIVTAPLASPEAAAQHVQDIHDALTASVLFESYVVLVGVSIGAAVFDAPSTLTIDTWLARADMALYRAKRDGRGCARIYDASIDTGDLPLIPSSRHPANERFKTPGRAA